MIEPKILLVDDDVRFAGEVKVLLENNNFRCRTCVSAEEAIISLSKDFYDIIICDVFLPFFGNQEGGLEIAKSVSERYPASFTVIISQYVTSALVNRFMDSLKSKRYRFINKSENFLEDLLEVIRIGITKKYIFVCMPFHQEYEDIYMLGIKPFIENLGFRCERADEVHHTGGIIERVHDLIKSAHLVIADISGGNPNVFYEIGYAHALGKEVIIITRDGKSIPTDLKKYHYLEYRKGKISKLCNDIQKNIKTLFELTI